MTPKLTKRQREVLAWLSVTGRFLPHKRMRIKGIPLQDRTWRPLWLWGLIELVVAPAEPRYRITEAGRRALEK